MGSLLRRDRPNRVRPDDRRSRPTADASGSNFVRFGRSAMTSDIGFALDTNICISILNETSEAARTGVSRLARSDFAVSSVVLFELYFGIRKSARFEQNLRVLRSF